jgi:hypothetical protein
MITASFDHCPQALNYSKTEAATDSIDDLRQEIEAMLVAF